MGVYVLRRWLGEWFVCGIWGGEVVIDGMGGFV